MIFKLSQRSSSAKDLICKPFKIVYDKITKEYRRQWYLKILYLETLGEIGEIEQIKIIQNFLANEVFIKLTSPKKGDWQVIYAGIDVLIKILCKSINTDIYKHSSEFQVKDISSIIDSSQNKAIGKIVYEGYDNNHRGLKKYLDYHSFLLKNNWRIRSKALESCKDFIGSYLNNPSFLHHLKRC